MAGRLWGCYSVADHLESRAFVADLLLYDRLVIPVPASDDVQRWQESGWDPERQQRLLNILDAFARPVIWSDKLQDQFERDSSAGTIASDIDDNAPDPTRPYKITRRIISEQLQDEVVEAGDVRGVAVYASPDRFDRDWRFGGSLPFVRRTRRVAPGELREVATTMPTRLHDLAKLVVTRLVVPDDGTDDEDVLKRAVQLVSRQDVSGRRAEFQQLVASLDAEGLRDDTIVGEVEDRLAAYNESIRRRTKANHARVAVQFVTLTEGAAGLWAPPIALAAGPTAAVGEAMINKRYDGADKPTLGAVSLLAEARRALS